MGLNIINLNSNCRCSCNTPFQMSPMGGNPYGLSLWNNYPPMGRCCSPCRHGDDKLGRALLIGAGLGLTTGLIYHFRKPLGKALAATGKAIGKAAVWTGKAIGKVAGYAWQGIKWTGKKIAQGATWLWNNTLGRLFKKKNKSTAAADGE